MTKEEFCIEVNEKDERIGLRPRKEFYKSKYIHRAVHLILFNSKNEILLQKRALTKKLYPNVYVYSVDGTVANESYEECIQREMKEEIGISINAKRLFTLAYFDDLDKAFHTVFMGNSDEEIVPDNREMSKIKWVKPEVLEKEIYENPEKYGPFTLLGMKKFFKEYYCKEENE